MKFIDETLILIARFFIRLAMRYTSLGYEVYQLCERSKASHRLELSGSDQNNHPTIIDEIRSWRRRELIYGRDPRTIKLASHHLRALRNQLEDYGAMRGDAPYSTLRNRGSVIFGMEIIPV